MGKQKIQLIATGVLVLVFVVILANSLKPKGRRRPARAATEAKAPGDAAGAPAAARRTIPEASWASPKEREAQRERAQLDWGLDPFYHALSESSYQSSDLFLKGITIGKDQRGYVFINTEIFTEGDIIPGFGYKVMKIHKDKVLLKRGGEQFYLPLPEE